MKYKVAIKLNTVIYREVEANSEDDIYDAIDEARAEWDYNDVLVDMEEIDQIFLCDENGSRRELDI